MCSKEVKNANDFKKILFRNDIQKIAYFQRYRTIQIFR